MKSRKYSKFILSILIFTFGFLLYQSNLVNAEQITKNISEKQEVKQDSINYDEFKFKEGDAALVMGNEAENFSLIMLCKQAKVPVLFFNKDSTWENIASTIKEKNIRTVVTIFRTDRIFDFDYLVEYDGVKNKLKELEVEHKEISGDGSEEISLKIFNSFNNLANILILDSETAIKESESLLSLYNSDLSTPLLVVNKNEIKMFAREYAEKENIKQVYIMSNMDQLEDKESYSNEKVMYIKDKEEFGQKILGLTKEEDLKENDATIEDSKYPKAPVIEDIYVVNGEQTSRYYIYKEPKWNSKVIGYLYGDLTELKILDKVGEFSYVEASNYGTAEKIKGYIASSYIKKVSPTATQSILVDISDQRVYVYEKNKLIREIICSTGKNGTDTPTGRFLIGDRGSSFSGPGYTCYNYVRFNYNYLFHSVLYYRGTTSVIKYIEAQLGNRASHGCIRLPGEDAKWFYNNIKTGTLVTIQD